MFPADKKICQSDYSQEARKRFNKKLRALAKREIKNG